MPIPAWHNGSPASAATDVGPSSDPGASTRALVQAAQNGETEVFGRIFDQFHVPVYRYIAARLGSAADAEDLAAETFAAAFLAIQRFRWRGVPFEAWLFRIARSKLVDHQRRTQRQPTSRLDDAAESGQANSGDPARELARDEERLELLAAMRRLSPDQQEVIALRFFAEISVPEVGRVMGRSDSAVRQLQFRAVTALRQHLERLR